MYEVILDVNIDDTLTQEWLTYAGYHIRDARDPLRDTMWHVVFPAIREQLDSQGSRSGHPYEQLSLEYERWKDLHYPGQPILSLTGAMERALFDPLSFRVTKDTLRYRPQSEYLHWHQEGGYVEGRPPQRIVVELTAEDEMHIHHIFEEWLDELRLSNRRRGNNLSAVSFPNINTL